MRPMLMIGITIMLLLQLGTVSAHDPSVLASQNTQIIQAQNLNRQGDHAQALKCAKLALSKSEAVTKLTGKKYQKSLILIGDINVKLGYYEAAGRAYRKALRLHSSLYGVDHPNSAILLCKLAEIASIQGQHADAEILFDGAKRILDPDSRRVSPTMARALMGLASAKVAQENFIAAARFYQAAANTYSLLTKYDPSVKTDVTKALFYLGQIHQQTRNYASASAAYREALRYSDYSPNGAMLTCLIMEKLGDTYTAWNKPARAKHVYKRKQAITRGYTVQPILTASVISGL